MGHLLALKGQVPLPAMQWGEQFFRAAGTHRDGWALSGFSNQRAVYFGRSMNSAVDEPDATRKALEKAQASNTPFLIGHCRQSTNGQKVISSVHPFHHRDWIFAHDGDIEKPGDLTLSDLPPQGQSDSERFFHWLMERAYSSSDPASTLRDALDDFRSNAKYSALTFVLTDGQRLWAHVESREKQSLLYVRREQRGTYLCSKPLENSGAWSALPEKKLIEI